MTEQIIAMIAEVNPFEDVDRDTELIESGIIDSLSLVFVISQIQNVFGVEVPEELLQAENFASVNKIEELIRSLQ